MNPVKKLVASATAFVFAFSLVSCGSQAPDTLEGSGKAIIKVGSKDFTESMVVSEVYALALEDAGYNVERVSSIASSLIHTSILNREVDIYPEYTIFVNSGKRYITYLTQYRQTVCSVKHHCPDSYHRLFGLILSSFY